MQGWSNYITWNVYMWIKNNPEWYAQIEKECLFGNESIFEKTERLKVLIQELNPLAKQDTLFADLLSFGLDQVNWYELIEHFLKK
ncbi:MAG: hypothetical protein HQK77_02010 [Desulfobacterales bacterium]|nr:hypothetical protein [Desulfobacterales bacterium]